MFHIDIPGGGGVRDNVWIGSYVVEKVLFHTTSYVRKNDFYYLSLSNLFGYLDSFWKAFCYFG